MLPQRARTRGSHCTSHSLNPLKNYLGKNKRRRDGLLSEPDHCDGDDWVVVSCLLPPWSILIFTKRPPSNRGGRAFAPGPITLWEEKKLLQFSRQIWGFSVKKLSAQSADDPEHPCSALSANCPDRSLRGSASLGRKARPHGADEPAPQHGRPPAFHIEPFVHHASDKDCYSG